tara:strand:+ start:1134 stop:3152 length:2019 start_codon:yes stop_codon:yes gene_type:complete
MEQFFEQYLDQLIGPFVDPRKRVFLGYLASALLIAFCVKWAAKRFGNSDVGPPLFSRKIWWSPSARLDYMIVALNQVVTVGLAGRLLTKLAVATLLFESMHIWFDGRIATGQNLPGWAIAAIFTVTLFLLDDLAKYLVHRAMHRIPLLWCFHKVHHSAETLNPLTVYRTHPLEGIIFAFRATLVQGTSIATFFYFFGNRAELITVLGVNAILFAFNAAGSNLRHSHVWISYGRSLERVFMSPAQHQIHHSIAPRHCDKNYGAVLALWDWLGGSLTVAGTYEPLRFGLQQSAEIKHDLITAYLTPIGEALQNLHNLIKAGLSKMFSFSTTKKIRQIGVNSILGAAVYAGSLAATGDALAAELNIYSHRQPFLIEPFIKAYAKQTGTNINIVYASKGLAQRLQAEGARSPADVILTVDIARLNVYADKKLLAQVNSKTLQANVPDHLRDPDNRWFAFSKRARVVVVSKEATDAQKITRYEDLTDPKWKGRICARPGSHVYNRALIASLINASGEAGAEKWARGVYDNLARRPQGNDRAQVKAIYEGVCDIAIINNYYFGKLKHSNKGEHQKWANSVNLIFPNQSDRGTHVNISGGGVALHSKNKEEAVRFLEFLTSKAAQDLYGSVNYEYPVNPNIPVSAELRSWGTFEEDQMPIARIADLAPKAQRIIDKVGW